MFPSQYLSVMLWINIKVCCPLIFLVIFLCFVVRLDHIPITYYINLLISNLIQITLLSIFMHIFMYIHPSDDLFLFYCYSGVGSVCFRMIFAVERCLFLCRPQFDFLRKIRGFVTVCVLTWMLLIVLFTILFSSSFAVMVFLPFTAIMFIICLAVTLMSICTPTLDQAEEKCRVVGSLFILLVNYAVIIVPVIVSSINPYLFESSISTHFTLILHCPLIDFLLLVFISKWPFIRLLMCLGCCRRRNPAMEERSPSAVRQDRQLSSDTLMKKERQANKVLIKI